MKQMKIENQVEVKLKNKRKMGKFRQLLATVCLGPISLGASLSWTSPVLPQLTINNSTNITHHNLTSNKSTTILPLLEDKFTNSSTFRLTVEEGSWIGAMLAIGVLTAAIPSGYLAGRFGPKKSIIGLLVPNLLFTIIAVCSNDLYTMCLARLFSGMSTGGISVVGPMYISEIADVSLRGTLGSFFESLIYVGVLFVAICGAYVSYTTLTVILGVLALGLGSVFFLLPESPAYLIKLNKREEAVKALKFYRSEGFNIDNALDDLYERVHSKTDKKINIWNIFKSKAVIRGLIACVGLTIFQQLSGIDGVVFYTVQIFQATSTPMNEYTSAIILSSVQLLSAIFIVFVIEKAGRKVFLYISVIGACICLTSLAMYFHFKIIGITFFGIDAIPLGSTIIYACAFSAGLGPVPWMINGELFPTEIKGVANGITITTNWTLVFIITKTLPVMMVQAGPHYTFYMFALCMFVCVLFIKFCIPETRGKSLDQIQKELNS